MIAPVNLNDLFDRFERAGLRICVMRGYEALPSLVENDLDLMIAPSDVGAFRAILLGFATDRGLRLVAVADHRHVTLIRFLGVDEDGSVVKLVVDEHTRGEGWWDVPYLTNAEIIRDATGGGAWVVPRPAHEAAMALLSHLLIGKRVKLKHVHRLPELISADRTEFRRILTSAFGSRLTDDVMMAVERRDGAQLDRLAWRLRLALVVRGVSRRPWLTLNIVRDRWAQVRLKMRRRGVVVHMRGPDQRAHAADLSRAMRLVFKDTWFLGRDLAGLETVTEYGQSRRIAGRTVVLQMGAAVLRERLALVSGLDEVPRLALNVISAGQNAAETLSEVVKVLSRRDETDVARFLSSGR